jgi:hypothetical protein
MPRGNDAAEAAKELGERYKATGNAENLIRANKLRNTREMRIAANLEADEQATEELDLKAVAKAAELPKGANIVGATVRGGYVVYAYRGEDGRTLKGALKRGARGGLKAPELTAEEEEAAQSLEEDDEKAAAKS